MKGKWRDIGRRNLEKEQVGEKGTRVGEMKTSRPENREQMLKQIRLIPSGNEQEEDCKKS